MLIDVGVNAQLIAQFDVPGISSDYEATNRHSIAQ